jgi:CelD/BcsL family acetyltransferase involved in cellulose biosynthesis
MIHASHERFSIRVLTNWDEIAAIKPAWQSLYSKCDYATPFQRPEWLLPWIECFGPREPLVLEVRRNKQIVGLAPMLIYRNGSERVLGLMGGGVSDYLDVLINPEYSREALDVLLNYFVAESRQWDYVDLTDLSSESPLLGLAVPSWNGDKSEHDVCPVIDLADRTTDLSAVVPSRQLRNFRNAQARLLRAGKSRFDIAQPSNLNLMLNGLFRLHDQRWRDDGSPGVLADPAVRRFHRVAGSLLLEQEILRLHGLWLEDRYVAVLYSLVERGRVYCYLQGFDPEFHSLSPGTLILGHVLEDALRLGARHVDLLRGSEAYKYSWGAHDVSTHRVILSEQSRAPQAERIVA